MAAKKPLPAPPPVSGLDQFAATLKLALEVAATHPDSLPGMHPTLGNPVSLAPRIPEASTMATKLVDNATAGGQHWVDGTLNPRKDPIAAMKRSVAKYTNAVQAALANKSWEKGVNNIDEAGMYETIRTLGSGVFTAGLAARKGKIERVFAKMRPFLVALAGTLDAMPTDTDQQREAKMIAAKRGMQEIGKKMAGG
jgi:hypothetical protein